jgi:Flp pilus assembly pilin Flp
MNPFEEYTLIIGLIAVAIEGITRLSQYIRETFHHKA